MVPCVHILVPNRCGVSTVDTISPGGVKVCVCAGAVSCGFNEPARLGRCVDICTYMYMFIYMYINMYLGIMLRKYVCVYVYLHVYICIHTVSCGPALAGIPHNHVYVRNLYVFFCIEVYVHGTTLAQTEK